MPELVEQAGPTRLQLIPRAPSQLSTHSMMTRAKNGISMPKVFLATTEPSFVSYAIQSSQWKQAMSNEYVALMKNQTWFLAPPPRDRKLIGCR